MDALAMLAMVATEPVLLAKVSVVPGFSVPSGTISAPGEGGLLDISDRAAADRNMKHHLGETKRRLRRSDDWGVGIRQADAGNGRSLDLEREFACEARFAAAGTRQPGRKIRILRQTRARTALECSEIGSARFPGRG